MPSTGTSWICLNWCLRCAKSPSLRMNKPPAMSVSVFLWVVSAVLTPAVPVHAQRPSSGKNAFVIRGREQTIHFYRATGGSGQLNPPVLFAPGDLGMHGVEARDHRFEGNQDGLFRALREGVEWI